MRCFVKMSVVLLFWGHTWSAPLQLIGNEGRSINAGMLSRYITNQNVNYDQAMKVVNLLDCSDGASLMTVNKLFDSKLADEQGTHYPVMLLSCAELTDISLFKDCKSKFVTIKWSCLLILTPCSPPNYAAATWLTTTVHCPIRFTFA